MKENYLHIIVNQLQSDIFLLYQAKTLLKLQGMKHFSVFKHTLNNGLSVVLLSMVLNLS